MLVARPYGDLKRFQTTASALVAGLAARGPESSRSGRTRRRRRPRSRSAAARSGSPCASGPAGGAACSRPMPRSRSSPNRFWTALRSEIVSEPPLSRSVCGPATVIPLPRCLLANERPRGSDTVTDFKLGASEPRVTLKASPGLPCGQAGERHAGQRRDGRAADDRDRERHVHDLAVLSGVAGSQDPSGRGAGRLLGGPRAGRTASPPGRSAARQGASGR